MRALLRLLLLGLLVAFLVHAVRRALAAGREQGGRGPRADRDRDGDSDGEGRPPQRRVCGACGHDFDAEQSGWLCPKCGK